MYNGILMWIIGLIAPIIESPRIFGLIGGAGFFFWLSFMKREKKILETVASICFATGLFWFGCWFFVTWFTPYNLKTPLYWWGGFTFLGLVGAFYAERNFLHVFEKGISGVTKGSSLERDRKTDIRELIKQANSQPKPNYDPRKYFKEDAWFLGLQDNKPIYFEQKNLPHFLLSGKSGVGKSLMLGVLGSQLIKKGEGGIVFDPKHGGDEYLPEVCRKACEEAGRVFNFIDLRNEAYQLNILEGASPREIEQLLITIFELENRGGDGDYFRGIDRDMARFVGENYKEGDTLASISKEYNDHFIKRKAENFAQKMREIAAVKSINARSGLNLHKTVENGEFVYVAGDWVDQSYIFAQRMLLGRVIQIAGKRDNVTEKPKQFAVILDEFSFQISKIFADSLKIIRDKGIHFIMAHQGLKDLNDVPENMKAETFASSVLTNCGLKFTYRAVDVETAEYFAKLSGEILVDDEIRHVEKSLSLTETVSHDRQVRQTERFYIDTNTLQTLPEGHGVFFGDGLAKISAVAPMQVEKSAETRKVKGYDQSAEDVKNENALFFEDLE